MKFSYPESVVSFFIGVSWIIAISLGVLFFMYSLALGIVSAILSSLVGLTIGFLFVAFFEALSLLQDIALQSKRQTALLEKLLTSLNDKTSSTQHETISDN